MLMVLFNFHTIPFVYLQHNQIITK